MCVWGGGACLPESGRVVSWRGRGGRGWGREGEGRPGAGGGSPHNGPATIMSLSEARKRCIAVETIPQLR